MFRAFAFFGLWLRARVCTRFAVRASERYETLVCNDIAVIFSLHDGLLRAAYYATPVAVDGENAGSVTIQPLLSQTALPDVLYPI